MEFSRFLEFPWIGWRLNVKSILDVNLFRQDNDSPGVNFMGMGEIYFVKLCSVIGTVT